MRQLALLTMLAAVGAAGAVHAQPTTPSAARSKAVLAAPAAGRPSLIRPAAGALRFKVEPPAAPDSMPVVRLTAQAAPTALVDRVLGASRQPAKLTPLATSPLFRENRLQVPEDAL